MLELVKKVLSTVFSLPIDDQRFQVRALHSTNVRARAFVDLT